MTKNSRRSRVRCALTAVTVWGMAWMLLWWLLSMWIAPRPTHRIDGMGADTVRCQEFVDSNTLLLTETGASVDHNGEEEELLNVGRHRLLDLSTGEILRVDVTPEPRLGAPSVKAMKADSFRFFYSDIVGDDLIAYLTSDGDYRGFEVRRWKTGELIQRREFSKVDVRPLGPRIGAQSQDPSVNQIDLFDVATGQTRSVEFPGKIRLRHCRVSGNGDFVAFDTNDARVEVWNLNNGAIAFVAPAIHFAFSEDGRRFATVVDRRQENEMCLRTWRVYELASGRVEQERQEILDRDSDSFLTVNDLAFQDEGNLILVRGWVADTRPVSLWPIRRAMPLNAIDIWDWQRGKVETLRVPEIRSATAPLLQFKEGIPHRIVDGGRLLDVATGEVLGRVDIPNAELEAAVPGWGVLRHRSGPLEYRIARLLGWISTRLAKWFSSDGQPTLCDLTAGRSLFPLGRDRMVVGFSPEKQWLVLQSRAGLEVWTLPPTYSPWRAFLWSFLFSAAAPVLYWRTRRDPRPEATVAASSVVHPLSR